MAKTSSSSWSRLSSHSLLLGFITITLLSILQVSYAAEGQLVLERVERAAPATATEHVKKSASGKTFQEIKIEYNLADDVSEDYPVIFNIILFIAVSLILALIAICVTIANMDPGRDSLIYRVTSAQRYKKDN